MAVSTVYSNPRHRSRWGLPRAGSAPLTFGGIGKSVVGQGAGATICSASLDGFIGDSGGLGTGYGVQADNAGP